MTRSMFWMAVLALVFAGCAGCDSNRNDDGDRDLRCDEDCPYGDVYGGHPMRTVRAGPP